MMGFFRNSRSGKSQPLTREQQQLKLRRMRVAREILTKEYEDALAEFDRAKENVDMQEQAREACQRYIIAMRRLNRFLVAEEIPPDVEEKLNSASTD
jgi:hypothetical protein